MLFLHGPIFPALRGNYEVIDEAISGVLFYELAASLRSSQ
ncbi:hypothetical protein RFEPED_1551 [Rickettsia felis str. Pedreira]|uniref:Uncharacterized protein n=1 Tax=Rickettsia felis str. Pedreira TaxID=1359196 RepID=A0A0F3MTU5_RICFI|nr:hypothetical protein RFEPED_1551 [Rickettsia felis str. Pedreira]